MAVLPRDVVTSYTLTSPSHTYWVDDIGLPTDQQLGTQDRPFATIQQAIDHAVSFNQLAFQVQCTAGFYGDVSLPQDVGIVINGTVSGQSSIGNITWQASGNANPVPQSYILLRNCNALSVSVTDGSPPAVKALLIMENSALLGSISQVGSSVLVVLIAGISTAASSIAGINVSSLVLGNVTLDQSASLGLTNTQVMGNVTAPVLWAQGSQFNGLVTCFDHACQMINCIFGETSSGVVFAGSPGVLYLDDTSLASFLSGSGHTITNGTILPELRFVTSIPNGTSSYQVQSQDDLVVMLNQGRKDFHLPPSPVLGQQHVLKNGSPFGTYSIYGNGNTIDGQPTLTGDSSTLDSYAVVFTGPEWSIVAQVLPQGSGSVGLTATSHKTLAQLAHFIDDGPGDGFFANPYRERIGYPFVTQLTWWDSPSKNTRLFQKELTRSLGSFLVTTASYKVFDTSGNLLVTATDAISYVSGVFESSRTRSFS